MREDIRERIEMIKRGEVPEGYKSTKLGIIPDDWEICKIHQIANVSSGSTPSRLNEEYWNGDVPWITTSEINSSYIAYSNEYISDIACQKLNLKRYNPGSILMAMYGQGKTRGRVAMLKIEATVNQACAVISVKDINNLFLFYQLLHMYKGIRKLSNVGSQSNLNVDLVKNIKIIVPSNRDQRKMVDVFHIFDEKILKQEELIQQKKEQKKWLMQNLLTGQKRLTGFNLRWQKVELRNLLVEKDKRNTNKFCKNVKSISNKHGFINQEQQFGKSVASNDLSAYKIVQKNEIAYNPSRINVGSIALYEEDSVGVVSPMYAVFSTEENLDNVFFMQYIKSNRFKNKVKSQLSGSVRSSLKFGDLCSISIEIPDINEQRVIAQVLTTADREIELLEKQLEQIKLEKKAMMQLLLTGIVRVDKD